MSSAAKEALKRLVAGEDALGPDGIVRSVIAERELNLMVARLINGPDGKEFVEYLRSITINNVQGPVISTEELRHLEGQRFLVAVIERRADFGRRRQPQGKKEAQDGG